MHTECTQPFAVLTVEILTRNLSNWDNVHVRACSIYWTEPNSNDTTEDNQKTNTVGQYVRFVCTNDVLLCQTREIIASGMVLGQCRLKCLTFSAANCCGSDWLVVHSGYNEAVVKCIR